MCVCDREEHEHGVGASVNATTLLETLYTASVFRLWKHPWSCVHSDSEESLPKRLKTKKFYFFLNTYFRLTSVFRGLSFSFPVYGFDLLVKLLFVLLVLSLETPGLLWWLSSTNLVFPPYLFLCIYHLSKRHMMSDSLKALPTFVLSTVLVWHFSTRPRPSPF